MIDYVQNSKKVTIYVNLMMVLEVNEKEEQMVSTAYTTQKGFYRGTRLEWLHREAHVLYYKP